MNDDPLALINYALQNYPESVRFVNFAATVQRASVRRDSAGNRYGVVVSRVPTAVAHTLKGDQSAMDVLILVHIDRATYEHAQSGVVVPKLIVQ